MTGAQAMLSGGIAAAALVAALLFLRLWRVGRDPFFAWFAAAFALQALSRAISALPDSDAQGLAMYVLRLLGYLLIVAAIWSKNRSSATDRAPGTDRR